MTHDLLESLLSLATRETEAGLTVRPVVHVLARTATWDDLPWLAARRPLPVFIDLTSQEPLPTSALVRWLLKLADVLPDRKLHLICDPKTATTLRLLGIHKLLHNRLVHRSPSGRLNAMS